jgi:lysozyme family protein
MRTQNVTYVSINRFETLANRHVTMQRNSVIVIQSEPHPESGAIHSVELKYDGDGYLLDGKPLMVNQRDRVNPWGHHITVSGGCLSWKDSAARAMKLLSDKEGQGAREFCDMQDEMFMQASGYRW